MTGHKCHYFAHNGSTLSLVLGEKHTIRHKAASCHIVEMWNAGKVTLGRKLLLAGAFA